MLQNSEWHGWSLNVRDGVVENLSVSVRPRAFWGPKGVVCGVRLGREGWKGIRGADQSDRAALLANKSLAVFWPSFFGAGRMDTLTTASGLRAMQGTR